MKKKLVIFAAIILILCFAVYRINVIEKYKVKKVTPEAAQTVIVQKETIT